MADLSAVLNVEDSNALLINLPKLLYAHDTTRAVFPCVDVSHASTIFEHFPHGFGRLLPPGFVVFSVHATKPFRDAHFLGNVDIRWALV